MDLYGCHDGDDHDDEVSVDSTHRETAILVMDSWDLLSPTRKQVLE
jgi:hypothetical protein